MNALPDLPTALSMLQGLQPPQDTQQDADRSECLGAQLRVAIGRGEADGQLGAAAADLLRAWPAECASPGRVEALLAATQLQHLAARPSQSRQTAGHAVALARRLGHRPLLRKSLTFLGVTQLEDGRLPEALACHAEALEIAQDLGDTMAIASTWNNIGLTWKSAAQWALARPCFERAVALGAAAPEMALPVRAAWCNLAGCAAALQDTAVGLAAVQQALALNPAPCTAVDCLSRAIAEANHVRLLCDAGRVTEAQARLDLAAALVERASTPRSLFVLEITRGMVDVHAGRVEAGLQRLKQQLELARRQVRSEVHEALQACIQAYEAAGQADVALIYLHEQQALHRQTRVEPLLQRQTEHLAGLAPALEEAGPSGSRQARLRSQLGQRELLRRRTQLLEQQSVAAELHDDNTGEHCYRVGRLASILGQEIGLEDEVCFLLDLTARLHDIGKLVVPDAILLKPGRLTDGERAIMQTHTTAGADILARSDLAQMHVAQDIARHHHERWDGTGYPLGLARDAIPIAARVTALADVFDALTHARPYKRAWPLDRALAEITALRGRQFDPELCDAFLRLVPRLLREVGDLDVFLAEAARETPLVHARHRIARAWQHGR